jgi:hypothetical protein
MKKKPLIPTWAQMLISFFILLFIVLKCESCMDAEEEEPKVTWHNYDTKVKARIDSLVLSKNCSLLQVEFNNAELNSTAQRSRTGEGNASLMNFIDYKMRTLKCY